MSDHLLLLGACRRGGRRRDRLRPLLLLSPHGRVRIHLERDHLANSPTVRPARVRHAHRVTHLWAEQRRVLNRRVDIRRQDGERQESGGGRHVLPLLVAYK